MLMELPLGAACTLPDARPGRGAGGLVARLATFLASLAVPVATGVRRTGAAPRAADRVLGFRSSRFGMGRAQVRAAVLLDFPLATLVDPGQGELRVEVATLAPGPGAARVVYGFDAAGELCRIEARWRSSDAPRPPERSRFAEAGLVLASHYGSRRWGPGGAIGHRALGPNAVLLFAGWDAHQAAVEVRLTGARLALPGAGMGPEPQGACELFVCYRRNQG